MGFRLFSAKLLLESVTATAIVNWVRDQIADKFENVTFFIPLNEFEKKKKKKKPSATLR